MLYGKVLRSPYAHARIVSIDTKAAASLPGVKAVITAADLPQAEDRVEELGEGAANLRELSNNVLADEKVAVGGSPLSISSSRITMGYDTKVQLACFNQVAGKTDELGREIIDRAHDVFRIGGIAFVVKIGEVHEAHRPALVQRQVSDAEVGRLDANIGAEHSRQCQRA